MESTNVNLKGVKNGDIRPIAIILPSVLSSSSSCNGWEKERIVDWQKALAPTK
ncbi:hypothetical protein BGP_4698 [Beggiatoa sp. PS]|nr:hypothetical protein BGP_4698 [Beggiatoa sp. PS]